MTKIQQATQHIQDAIFPLIGEVKAKNFFSYYAIFKGELMFGLYKNDKFYLRLNPNAFQHTPWVGELTQFEGKKEGLHHKHYYYIPKEILNHPERYHHLLLETLAEVEAEKAANKLKHKTLIRSLPNLNISIERLLRKFGVYTVDDLRERGAISIFVEMIKRGMDVNKNMLFRLHCAIKQQPSYTLTEQQKRMLLEEVDQALYDAGLRKRFTQKVIKTRRPEK